MANTKISALPVGAPAVTTDLLPIARSGSNESLQVSDILNALSNGAVSLAAPIGLANGGTGCVWPYQGWFSIPGLTAVQPTGGTVNPTLGTDYDIYTVPSGKRAILVSVAFNPGGSAINYFYEAKVGGVYYRLQGSTNTASAVSGGATNPGYIAEAGESFSINSSQGTAVTLTQVVANTNQSLTLASVVASSGGTAVYNGTITGGGSNAFLGFVFVITGFAGANNNGTFICTASSATSLTLSNALATAETHVGNAASSTANAGFIGTIAGGAGNNFVGHVLTSAGFTNGANNAAVTVLASAGTCYGGAVTTPVNETHAGTALDNTPLNLLSTILLFPNTAPLRMVKLTTFVAGQNIVYTCPANTTAYNAGFSTFFNTSGSGSGGYTNFSGAARLIAAWLVRNGDVVRTGNQVVLVSAVGNDVQSGAGPGNSILSTGDSVVFETDLAGSTGQLYTLPIWENP